VRLRCMEPTSPFNPTNPTDELLLLQRINQELLATNQRQQREIDQLRHRLDLLLKRIYGPRSEKQSGPGLFDHLEPTDEPEQAPEATPEPIPTTKPTSTSNSGHGRKKLPTNLPRVRIDHDLSEAEKLCPCCQHLRVKIGEEITELLDFQPASIFVCEHHRAKYLCRNCVPLQFQTAAMPPQPIDKGIPGPGLLSHLVTSKYADHRVQGEAVHEMRAGLSRSGCRIRSQTAGELRRLRAVVGSVLGKRRGVTTSGTNRKGERK